MRWKKNGWKAALAAGGAAMLLATNGCSGLDMAMNDLEGSLVGDAFTVQTYDDGDSKACGRRSRDYGRGRRRALQRDRRHC